jgi:tetratricopeptide (TPR) repeat protein
VSALSQLYSTTIPHHIEFLIDSADIFAKEDMHESFNEAINTYLLSKKTKNNTHKAEVYNQLGVYFLRLGTYPISNEILLKARQIAEKDKDDISLVRITSNLGALHFLEKDFLKALELFNLTLDLNNKLLSRGNKLLTPHLQTIYMNIACAYWETGNLDAAIKNLKMALNTTAAEDESKKSGRITAYLGELYLQQKKYELASLFIKKGLIIQIHHNDTNEIISSYNNLTQYYIHTQHLDSAIITNTKAIEASKKQEINTTKEITKAYELKMAICTQTNKYKEAFEASQEYKLLNKQLINASFQQRNKQLYLENEVNKLLNKEEQEKKINSLINYFSLALFMTTGAIFVLLFLLHRARIKRNQLLNEHLQKELNIKKKELDLQLKYLQKKSELVLHISKHLLRLSSRLNIENDKVIEDIIADLQNDGETNDWREFTQKYQSVYTDFYDKLHTKSPELTAPELKTCSLLRLGMNSQDIALLIHQNTRSIEVKRSRIRRKLKLNNTDTSLSEYLKNL